MAHLLQQYDWLTITISPNPLKDLEDIFNLHNYFTQLLDGVQLELQLIKTNKCADKIVIFEDLHS